MLQAINLTKGYKQKIVLAGLSLAVQPGELFCLLGGPGTGKSTTMDLFLNLTKATSGNCMVGGFNVALQPSKPKGLLAYVPPVLPLYDHLTGLENLHYFSTMAGLPELGRADVQRLFQELGIADGVLDQPAVGYSIETRQRIGLAIAVARDAQALLMDEPTKHLEEATARAYLTLVRAYAEGSITGVPAAVLLTTGSAALAAEFGHKVGLLAKGKLVEILEAEETLPQEILERCLEFCPVPVGA